MQKLGLSKLNSLLQAFYRRNTARISVRHINKNLAATLIIALTMSSLSTLVVKPANATNVSSDITKGGLLCDERPPLFEFELADGTKSVIVKNFTYQLDQPLSLNFTVFANKSPNGRIHGILNASYTTSWQNETVILYRWNGYLNNFDDWYGKKQMPEWLNYTLVLKDIPSGTQQINFTVTKVALYGYGPFWYGELANTQTIAIIDSTEPTATPQPETKNQPITIPTEYLLPIGIITLVLVIAAMLFVRHRKTTNR